MLRPVPRNRLLAEWCAGVALVLLLALILNPPSDDASTLGNSRIDATVYDFLSRFSPVKADEDIVIVDIDNDSLNQIGMWPWPRSVHAEMLRRLVGARAASIGVDLLLIESSPDDADLARALRHAQTAGTLVVIPIGSTSSGPSLTSPLYPVPEVGLNAHLSHAHFRLDEDGVVRGLWLEEGGFPAFSLALAERSMGDRLPEVGQQALRSATAARREQGLTSGAWETSGFVLLPRLAAGVPRYSYGAILRDEVPMARFQDRIVLIGASASGLGDRYSSRALNDQGLLPGIDLHSAALAALMARSVVTPMPAWVQGGLTSALVVSVMITLYRSRPRAGMIAALLSLCGTLLLAGILLRAGYWWSPAGALIAIVVAYPWWSWRRLEVATAALARQVRTLQEGELRILPGATRRLPTEPIARGVLRLSEAAARAVHLRRFLLRILERLPYPAIVMAAHGELLFANQRVAERFGRQPPHGTAMHDWLLAQSGLDISSALAHPDATRSGVEVADRSGRDWLIDCASFEDPEWSQATLVQLVDISPIRAAQREREQTMRFLSHDLRSPQVTILAIIELQARQGPLPTWLEDVRHEAARSLELANGFVELARAEGAVMARESVDLGILIEEARDACWRQAQSNRASLDTTGTQREAWILGDPQLLRRAIVNLIDNAIKYGPQGGRVRIDLTEEGSEWCISVVDQGPGLTPDELSNIFQPYWRGGKLDRPGVGLGLSFVRVVAERHHGGVRARQAESGGARFELRLPGDTD